MKQFMHMAKAKSWHEQDEVTPPPPTDYVEGAKVPTTADGPVQLVATNSIKNIFTIVRYYSYGGTSTKKTKRFVITFQDPVNGVNIGGLTNKILATDLGFKVIEYCSNVTVCTSSATTAPPAVARILQASASVDGSYIAVVGTALAGGAPVDLVLASGALGTYEIGSMTIDGY